MRLALLGIFLAAAFMTPSAAATLQRVDITTLAGWQSDDLDPALDAFRRSCTEIEATGAGFSRPVRFGGEAKHWRHACRMARSTTDARTFFQNEFAAFRVHDHERPEGLFTGYFEPEVAGSLTPSPRYQVPVYARPDDLVAFPAGVAGAGLDYGRWIDGQPAPYHSREAIEAGALAGRGLELVWLRDWADAFFMQVQGSGRVRLENGTVIRLGYAAKSGRPYTSIGGVLADRGVIAREDLSMQSIRVWMAENPAEARRLMWKNESFVFFRQIDVEDPALGPPGGQKVQLTPERSLAIDRTIWMFGTPVWLDTVAAGGDGAAATTFRKLMVAQDTGSAIKGAARGDVFWGSGERAARMAGPMKSAGTMVVLLPLALADHLGLPR